MTRGGLIGTFGWPALIAVTSLIGLVTALFVDGAWDAAAAALIGLPLVAAALASRAATRRVLVGPPASRNQRRLAQREAKPLKG